MQSELEDYDTIHDNIEKGIIFKGTNLWILVFAIIIASVGLNTNSTAVIIGAMLISPLMGPINGMGYSIAIHDSVLFRSSIRNFSFAVGASLLASTLYFSISPVSGAQSELLARTSPTIYDVLIALFGGFAGIVAISSKNKGNVIPGVAIATALMPPLCTAGYGLATGQFRFFFGAFYLFTINTVCIAIASAVVSQILKFPIRDQNIDDSRKKKINQIISAVLTITVLPSIYLGYQLVQNEKFTSNANKYTSSVAMFNGNFLLRNEVDPNKKEIHLIYGGAPFNDDDKLQIKQRALDFSLDTSHINIEQGLAFEAGKDDNHQIQENALRQEINRLSLIIKGNEVKLDSIKDRFSIGKQLLTEISPLYPQVISCGYSEALVYSEDSLVAPIKSSFVFFKSNQAVKKEDQQKIQTWLEKRLETSRVQTYFD